MKTRKIWITATGTVLFICAAFICYAAYTHENEIDSPKFRAVYSQTAGTKLDDCSLCHRGGSYVSGGKTTNLGSCQWCHYKSDYGKTVEYDYAETLNNFGKDYLKHGRNEAAVIAIQDLDSDGDGYSNKIEITALRYPGDPNDDPTKVAAPSKVFTRDQIEAMPQHTQFLLLNASKSTDTYAEYTGVPMEDLLKPLLLPSATEVTVLSPDGYSQTHPFGYDATLNVYYINGKYPPAIFFYNEQADVAKHPATGWCDYSAPSVVKRLNGQQIVNKAGLKMILAFKRDGQYLTPGVLNSENKLDGEGPFRVVPPQKEIVPPDQRSTAKNAQDPGTWIWPYLPNGDHNVGASTRSTTIMKVGPLPKGTTDINLLEAGWNYIGQDKIVIYGAISPLENINEKLIHLAAAIDSIPPDGFMTPSGKAALKNNVKTVQKMIGKGRYSEACQKLQEGILGKIEICKGSASPGENDALKDCDNRTKLHWAANEIMVLMKILI
ncbi:MAG TPA: GEGP motif-containing diheme protein [Desulfomonilia bacterium]